MLVEIISAFGSLVTTGLGILAYKNKPNVRDSGLLEYEFTEQHKLIQYRIDTMLAINFYTPSGKTFEEVVRTYFVLHPNSGGFWEWNMLAPYFVYPITLDGSTRFVHFSRFKEYLYSLGGWYANDSLHENSIENVCKKIWGLATQTVPDGSYTPVNAGDDWKAYSYPSPIYISKYGNNVTYFKRCAPKNIGCQLFGKDISVRTFIFFIAAVALTVVSGGTLLAVAASLATTVANFVGIKDVDGKKQAVSELINIYNGAKVNMKKGKKEELLKIATDVVNIPDLVTTA